MIRTGIIGAGKKAIAQVIKLKKIPGVKLAGVYDKSHARAIQTAVEHELPSFDSPHELLLASDAIMITEPGDFSLFMAIHAIKKSKHLFLRAPGDFEISDLKKLISLANEADVKFQVERSSKFNPVYHELRDIISNPRIVNINRDIPLKADKDSIVWNYMLHDIELVIGCINSPYKKISATGILFNHSAKTALNARIEFLNGAVANIINNGFAEKTTLRGNFYHDNGITDVDFIKKEISTSKIADGNIISENQVISNITPGEKQLQSFFESIREKSYSAITNEDESVHLEIAMKIQEKVQMKMVNA